MVVHGFLELRISTFTSTVIFARSGPRRDGRLHVGVLRTCAVKVRRHRFHCVREGLFHCPPRRALRLAAELAFVAHFTRHACDFGSKAV